MIAYTNFLITGPDGYATNAENPKEALNLLADAMDWVAGRLAEQPSAAITIKEMRGQAKRIRAVNPVTAHWPRRYRFQGPGLEYFDFAAERNLLHKES